MTKYYKQLLRPRNWRIFSSVEVHTTPGPECKNIPSNLKGKSKSSQEWLIRQFSDPYVKKSRYENYRARSAFKLLEIDEKCNILKPGMVVIDCGAAPGSWTQVLVKKTNASSTDKSQPRGVVIAIDIGHMFPVEGATIITESDFTTATAQAKLFSVLQNKKADMVLSDMAPNATGVPTVDHDLIMSLAYSALNFTLKVLKPGGHFLCKLWDGNRRDQFMKEAGRFFETMRTLKPPASRSDSAELFVLARNFYGLFEQKT